MPIGFRAPLANTRQAQYQLLRQRAFLQQIVHQTTHSLARFFLEVDANYKQFKTAQRLRAAAQQRLEAQRAFYEEGRITIDRLPRRRQPVRQRDRPGGPVQDQLQHLDRRPRGGQGDAAGLRQHRRGRRPEPEEGVHPGQGPAGRAPPVPDPARRRPAPDPINGTACPTRSRRSRRPTPADDGAEGPLPGPGRPARPAADPVPAGLPGRRADADHRQRQRCPPAAGRPPGRPGLRAPPRRPAGGMKDIARSTSTCRRCPSDSGPRDAATTHDRPPTGAHPGRRAVSFVAAGLACLLVARGAAPGRGRRGTPPRGRSRGSPRRAGRSSPAASPPGRTRRR